MKRFLLVGNPTAQSGKNARRIEQARALFRQAGAQCDFLPTQPARRTIENVRHVLDHGHHDVVVAMGGDGTFREVAAALVASARRAKIAMAMLPTGTANDQGRSFGLSAAEDALADNVAVALAGFTTRLDGGRLTLQDARGAAVFEDCFFDSAAWGFSARVLSRRNEDRKRLEQIPILRDVWRDQAVYATATLATFLESYVVTDKFTVRAVVDGVPQVFERCSDFLLKGTRVYAGAWVIDRTSKHDDGFFEALPFRGKRDWTSKAIVDLDGNPLTEERLNAVGVEHSKPFRFRRLEMAFEVPPGGAPLCAQMDGEEIEATPRATVEVLPRVIELVVPEGAVPSDLSPATRDP